MLHYLVSLLAASSLGLAAVVPGRGLIKSDPVGASGDSTFDDIKLIPANPKLSKLTFRGKDTLNGLSLTLRSGRNFTQGGNGGIPTHLDLGDVDYVVAVELCWDQKDGATRIVYAGAIAAYGEEVNAGKKSKNCKKVSAPRNYGVVGAYGQAGDDVRQLGFYFARARRNN